MIQLIILLLFATIKLSIYCGENKYTTAYRIWRVLYEVDSRFNGKVRFKWQTCGKSIPTSKYLPIRAGTSTGNTRFEVVPLDMYGGIGGRYISKYKIQKYKILFYIYVTGKSTVLKINLRTTHNKNIYIQLNRNKIKFIDMEKDSRCLIKSNDGCKCRVDRLTKYSIAYERIKNKLSILTLNGWNQIKFSNTVWKAYYEFYIQNENSIKHRSFIPWNTTLPTECAKQDQYVLQNLDEVNYFELNMDFTYGQMDGLNTVLSCFKEIASENKLNVKIDGAYTTKYTIAKFEAQGKRSAKNEFYKLLTNRKKSAKCIEYTCINWNIDMTVSVSDNSQCTANKAIAMSYPQSINMIKVQLATNSIDSFIHLTTCLRNILADQYKLISVDKTNEPNGTAAIYIKPGGTAVTVIEKGMNKCYTSIQLICQNANILAKFYKKRRARILRIILIVFLSALVPIIALLVVYLIKRPLKTNEIKPVGTHNIFAAIHTALFGHFEHKGQMNSNTPTKNAQSNDNAKELTGMHTASVCKGT